MDGLPPRDERSLRTLFVGLAVEGMDQAGNMLSSIVEEHVLRFGASSTHVVFAYHEV